MPPDRSIAYAPAKETVLVSGGATFIHDKLIEAAMRSRGENYVTLPNPDLGSFQTGKAFGNRGQCNPTYFTVGNLIKYLQELETEQGLTKEQIIRKYVYVAAGGCGPCRFGMYITEYKKALRDAGFEGLRIVSFEHNKGIFQGEAHQNSVLEFTPAVFMTLIKTVMVGDILILLTHQMRPYERHKGSVDQAMEQCREIMYTAFLKGQNLTFSLYKCKKILAKVALDKTIQKPKVLIIGEFWAALTQGEGNYNLHRFLEKEGAECIPHLILSRLLLSIWEAEYQIKLGQPLAKENAPMIDFSTTKQKSLIMLARMALKLHFHLYAKAIGLKAYHLPDIEKLARLAEGYYTLECSGGEAHLEVGHLLESIEENLAHLVISIKPFGCMPSSSVSDGIQTLITSRFPEANFLSVETSGEGAANFYSRIQMALHKARELAKGKRK